MLSTSKIHFSKGTISRGANYCSTVIRFAWNRPSQYYLYDTQYGVTFPFSTKHTSTEMLFTIHHQNYLLRLSAVMQLIGFYWYKEKNRQFLDTGLNSLRRFFSQLMFVAHHKMYWIALLMLEIIANLTCGPSRWRLNTMFLGTFFLSGL